MANWLDTVDGRIKQLALLDFTTEVFTPLVTKEMFSALLEPKA